MSKQTFQPSKRKHQRVHGFFARMKSRTGILIIKRRRLRGRKKLTA